MAKRSSEERASKVYKRSARFRRETRALGARVRRLRVERNLTLEAAAEAMHMDWKHLQKIESGVPPINVTMVTLLRVAEGLRVPLSALWIDEPK
jgi:transcriptional regulator with XRE-family HTH domain